MSEAYKKVETARLVTRPKASEFIKNIFDDDAAFMITSIVI